MKEKHLEELIQLYVSDTLSGEEAEELRDYLSAEENADGRRQLRRALEADAYLQEMAAGNEPEKRLSIAPAPQARSRALWLCVGGMAAAFFFGLWMVASEPKEDSIKEDQSVATVLRLEGELNGETPQGAGSCLQKGVTLEMETGLIEAAFLGTGVHLIATAPLSITLEGNDRIFLHKGEVKLHVPPQGIGFVVDTIGSSVTDLGTSFVVSSDGTKSEVLVLDGLVSVADHQSGRDQLMAEGQHARFDPNAAPTPDRMLQHTGLPELALPSVAGSGRGLTGAVFGVGGPPADMPANYSGDYIGEKFLSLVQSGFTDESALEGLAKMPLGRFRGIAGGYSEFPRKAGLASYDPTLGWMAWYHGQVQPPKPGRYRFWGYADNHLLVGLNGKVVFDGSRYDSAFRLNLRMQRSNYAAWPCLNAPAGFAAGEWFTVGEGSQRLDLLFGELAGDGTSAILLIEREGESYEETYWGQPKWSLFLTETEREAELLELTNLRQHMEQKLMGSYSISHEAVWQVQ